MRAHIQTLICTLALLSLGLGVCSCKSESKTRRFRLNGDVVAVDKRAQEALIRHEEIPGFMGAMTMSYRIKDPAEFAKLEAGQRIHADLVVTENSSWLEKVEIEPRGEARPAPIVSQFHMPQPGESVPDFQLIDQDGKVFHLKDRYPALITFIYTRCPLPDYCPRVNANFRALAAKSQDNAAIKRLNLITVSIDPEYDTPSVLKSYRKRWVIPESGQSWTFAVPLKQDMPEMLHFFAMTAVPADGVITHSLSTTLVSKAGKVQSWWHGNDWTANDILNSF